MIKFLTCNILIKLTLKKISNVSELNFIKTKNVYILCILFNKNILCFYDVYDFNDDAQSQSNSDFRY